MLNFLKKIKKSLEISVDFQEFMVFINIYLGIFWK